MQAHLMRRPERREEVVDAGSEDPRPREDLRLHQPRLGRVAHCAGAFLCLSSSATGATGARQTHPGSGDHRRCQRAALTAPHRKDFVGPKSSASTSMRASPWRSVQPARLDSDVDIFGRTRTNQRRERPRSSGGSRYCSAVPNKPPRSHGQRAIWYPDSGVGLA